MSINEGKKWNEQTAKIELDTFLGNLRAKIFYDTSRTGIFDITDLDHNSTSYAGGSNKQLSILASRIRNGRELSYRKEAVPLIMARVLGLPDPVDHEEIQRQERLDALLRAKADIEAQIDKLRRIA